MREKFCWLFIGYVLCLAQVAIWNNRKVAATSDTSDGVYIGTVMPGESVEINLGSLGLVVTEISTEDE